MPGTSLNSFGAKSKLKVGGKSYEIFRLDALEKRLKVSRLPFTLKIFLENMLRHEDGRFVKAEDIEAAAEGPKAGQEREVFFMPARVLMQDFTGVPAVVDLAAMRDAMKRLGGDPKKINPLVPVDLVIDHSVQVDRYGDAKAFGINAQLEFERNVQRYSFLKWGQKAFKNFTVVPPETGIVHQVNLEYLASVVAIRSGAAFPDSLVGTDSHTTMINGLGVLGWGVGGIEAEAVMLGQPLSMLLPEVVGVRLTGRLPSGTTATDAVLTVTELLRKKGVVGKFVEFFGPGLPELNLADRATIANMCPEYGATVGFFPVDEQTLQYLELSGRSKGSIALVKAYCQAQGLFRDKSAADPVFSDIVELDLSSIVPSLAGPKRPQDRVPLAQAQQKWREALPSFLDKKDKKGMLPAPAGAKVPVSLEGESFELAHDSVVIAAITSCTNTSNPSVMIGAGLLAKKAVAKGLRARPWVKTSLAPGSKVVIDYLRDSGVLPALEKLRFHLVGYGCTTCIGNSGPLPEPVGSAIAENRLVTAAVLSGNRNFEGRINPHVKANYLASPPLVVAYALAGRMDIDLLREPLAQGKDGKPVYLKDIWPSNEEVAKALKKYVRRALFTRRYKNVYAGDSNWKGLKASVGELFRWDPGSTYIKHPPYFERLAPEGESAAGSSLRGARVLAILGDSVTTDHISPAGNIPKDSPAGIYLAERGVTPTDFNSYGARRGNHELMMRGTFANIRLRNLMAPGTEGGVTLHWPDGESMSIFDAAMRYAREGVPLVVLAGKEYGSGSSRDWAAKGPALLGVKAVIAESYERIHRSNLVGMGVLPLMFKPGENAASLGLTGKEAYSIDDWGDLRPKMEVAVRAEGPEGIRTFSVILRIDTPVEIEYYRNGGILPYVLRQLQRPASARRNSAAMRALSSSGSKGLVT